MPTALRAVLLGLVAATAVGASGCTTAIVNYGRQTAGDPLRELSGMAKVLEAVDVGTVELRGTAYRALLVPAARHACSSSRAVELLLPVAPGGAERAVMREAATPPSATGPRLLIYDSISAPLPVTAPVRSSDRPSNAEIVTWLSGLALPPEGVSAAVFGFDQSGNNSVIMYRIGGSAARAVRLKSELAWVCRSPLQHALLIGAYPLAAAFDVATFPVQLVLLILSAH